MNLVQQLALNYNWFSKETFYCICIHLTLHATLNNFISLGSVLCTCQYFFFVD